MSESTFNPGLLDLLPHRGKMRLIDEMLEVDETSATTRVHIRADAPGFVTNQGMPGWMALEYMAQTVGLVAGMQAARGQWELSNGYLLGTRRFRCETPWFDVGTVLLVYGKQELMIDSGIGSFTCNIRDEHDQAKELAFCRLTIYRNPPDQENVRT